MTSDVRVQRYEPPLFIAGFKDCNGAFCYSQGLLIPEREKGFLVEWQSPATHPMNELGHCQRVHFTIRPRERAWKLERLMQIHVNFVDDSIPRS